MSDSEWAPKVRLHSESLIYTHTVEIGQAAPHLKLPATSGGEVELSEGFARNRATILAFYVLDFTPG